MGHFIWAISFKSDEPIIESIQWKICMKNLIAKGVLTMSLFSVFGCASSERKISDHFDGKKFFYKGAPPQKSFFDLLKWQMTGEKVKWPEWLSDNEQPNLQTLVESDAVWITHINHASHLIQLNNLNILTDPIFSERASPYDWVGPKRIRSPGVQIDELPKIDVVIVSHNHYDHMDLKSIAELEKRFKPLFIVPLGNASHIKNSGAKNVHELDWWESKKVGVNQDEIFLTPVHHWSARGLFDQNESLWGGYVIQSSNLKLFFGGDSAYGPFFKEIYNRFGAMDVSIIPIGAYEPQWFMKDQHLNPEEAVQVHLDLKSRLSIGTHFGTFPLTDEGYDQPVIDLQAALLKLNISKLNFVTTKNGGTVYFRSN